MNKIKVIDLLNRIANGEELPLIKYRDKILHWNKEKDRFEDKNGINTLYEMDFSELNDEVEIIEDKPFNERVEEIYDKYIDYIYNKEDKKIERIGEITFRSSTDNIKEEVLLYKINEIIDYINKEDK